MYGKTCATRECTPCLTSELYHLVEVCETDLGAQLHGLGPKASIYCMMLGIKILSSISSEMPPLVWHPQLHHRKVKIQKLGPASRSPSQGIRDSTQNALILVRSGHGPISLAAIPTC